MRSIHAGGRGHPVRNVDAGELLESLLVYAVATILLIRIILGATGYPQIGGSGLHIAHMLWGGLFMLAAIVTLVAFLGKGVVRLGAILGGIGFGLFIDELGKFITADNNYFFQPTIAIIYIIFVGLFLAFRAIRPGTWLTVEEALINAIDLLKEAARNDFSEGEKRRALGLLARSDARDPMVPALTTLLQSERAGPDHAPGWSARLAHRARGAYRRIVDLLWFTPALIAVFGLLAVLDLASVAHVVTSDPGFRLRSPHLSFVDWADLVSSTAVAGAALVGIAHLRASRLEAYRWFERSLLISIFLSQVFFFYSEQMLAAIGLAISLLLLAAIRYMIRIEEREERRDS